MRGKAAVLLLVALGALGLALSGSGGAGVDLDHADRLLAEQTNGFVQRLAAARAQEAAAARTLVGSQPLAHALAGAGADAPKVDSAKAFEAAVNEAAKALPEGFQSWAVAALATPKGALAVLPGHEPLTAAAFEWIEKAAAAGAAGLDAEVAGKKVHVHAMPLFAVEKGEAHEIGKVAVAFERSAASLGALAGASKVALIEGGKLVAGSTGFEGAEALEVGQPRSTPAPAGLLPMFGPAGGWPLSRALAIAVPGEEGLKVAASVGTSAAMVAAESAQTMTLGGMVLVLLVGVGVIATAGSAAAAPAAFAEPSSEPSAAPAWQPPASPAAATPAPSMPAAPRAAPPQMAEAQTDRAVEPELEPEPEPAPEPVAELAPEPEQDPMATFDAAFPAPPVASEPPSAAANAANELDALFGDAKALGQTPPPPTSEELEAMGMSIPKGDEERTTAMSRAAIVELASQSLKAESMQLPPPPPPPPPPGMSVIALPGSSPHNNEEESTRVASIPAELIKAATPNPPAESGLPLAVPGSEEAHFQEIFREFVATREKCGEPQDNLTYDKFAVKLRKNKEQLVEKYKCRTVRFQVYVKEGKAALKATPVKEG